MNETIFHDSRFGYLRCFPEFRHNRNVYEITVFMKTPEQTYRFYRRDFNNWEKWSEKEVDWSGTLIGKQSLRLDFEFPKEEWEDADPELRKTMLVQKIQEDFDNDDLFAWHVETVRLDEKYEDGEDDEMWAKEKWMHNRIADMELQLRELRREYAALWRVGNRRFDWAERL